jgi:hypothetical protein
MDRMESKLVLCAKSVKLFARKAELNVALMEAPVFSCKNIHKVCLLYVLQEPEPQKDPGVDGITMPTASAQKASCMMMVECMWKCTQ